jgi:hypothetical protein
MVRKPWAVWAAQTVCLFVTLSTLYFCPLLEDPTSRNALAFVGIFYLLLAVAAQRRLSFSRWALVVMFGFTALTTLYQVLRALSSSSDDTMTMNVGTGTFVVLTVIAVNLALSDSSQQYFVVRLRD